MNHAKKLSDADQYRSCRHGRRYGRVEQYKCAEFELFAVMQTVELTLCSVMPQQVSSSLATTLPRNLS